MTDEYDPNGSLETASMQLDDALIAEAIGRDRETLARRARAEIDAWLDDHHQPDRVHIAFFEQGDLGVTVFACDCGHEVIGRDDDREYLSVRHDDTLRCPACEQRWQVRDRGLEWVAIEDD